MGKPHPTEHALEGSPTHNGRCSHTGLPSPVSITSVGPAETALQARVRKCIDVKRVSVTIRCLFWVSYLKGRSNQLRHEAGNSV